MVFRDLLSLRELSREDILGVADLAQRVKVNSKKYEDVLRRKTLLMIFSKPSLRTHLSFDIGMYQLGGHAIFYDLHDSTLGEKENIKDFSKVISRYADIIMARLYSHRDLIELAKYSDVPVINGLTDAYHPCQILGDLLTMKEHLGNLRRKKVVYLGDANNNVTHDLIIACDKLGINITISSPKKKEFFPNENLLGGAHFVFEENPRKAVENADVIYTDTWMSYHISEERKKARMLKLRAYQVNKKLMSVSKKALFMHCLPAHRGDEVTSDVLDSSRSIVYDQAENRTYAEKAVLLKLMGK